MNLILQRGQRVFVLAHVLVLLVFVSVSQGQDEKSSPEKIGDVQSRQEQPGDYMEFDLQMLENPAVVDQLLIDSGLIYQTGAQPGYQGKLADHPLANNLAPLRAMSYMEKNPEIGPDGMRPVYLANSLLPERQWNPSDDEISAALKAFDAILLFEYRDVDPGEIVDSPDTERKTEQDSADVSEFEDTEDNSVEFKRKLAVQYALRGRTLFGLGVFDLAMADLNRSLLWHTDDRVIEWRGDCLFEMGRYSEALEIFDELANRSGNPLDLVSIRVLALLELGEFEKAEAVVAAAAAVDPQYEQSRKAVQEQVEIRREELAQQAAVDAEAVTEPQWNEAMAAVRELSGQPSSEQVDRKLLEQLKVVAFGQLDREQWDDAIDSYDKRIMISERLGESNDLLSGLYYSRAGIYYREKDQRQEAFRDLRKALELNEKNGKAWELMAVFILTAGEYEKAADAASVAVGYLKDDPENSSDPALQIWGTALRKQGRLKEAFSMLVSNANADLNSGLAMNEICEICNDPGFLNAFKPEAMEESQFEYDRFLHNQSTNVGRIRLVLEASTRLNLMSEPYGHRHRATALASIGLVELALADTAALIQQSNVTADDWRIHAQTLAANDRLDEAIEASEQSIKMAPNDPIVWSVHGFMRSSQDRFEAAIGDFNKSLELQDADDDSDLQLRIRTLISRGDAWNGLSGSDDGNRSGDADQAAKTEYRTKALADYRAAQSLVDPADFIFRNDLESRIRQVESIRDIDVPEPGGQR